MARKEYIREIKMLTYRYENNIIALEEYRFQMAFLRGQFNQK